MLLTITENLPMVSSSSPLWFFITDDGAVLPFAWIVWFASPGPGGSITIWGVHFAPAVAFSYAAKLSLYNKQFVGYMCTIRNTIVKLYAETVTLNL